MFATTIKRINSLASGTYTLFTSSLIWGTIGPQRMYGRNALYGASLYGFLVGALLPIPFYLLSRWRFPELRHVYTPILLSGGMWWAPINLSWIIPSLYLGYIFQVYMRRKTFRVVVKLQCEYLISTLLISCLVSYFQRIDMRNSNCSHCYILRITVSRHQRQLVGKL